MNWHCPFQVLACLISVILDFSSASNFEAFTNDSTFCFWSKSLSDGRTHRTFLRRSGERRSLVLYDSIWSRDNRLEDCITSDDLAVTEIYRSKCSKNGSGSFVDAPHEHFDVSAVVGPVDPCVATGRLSGLKSSRARRSRDLESVNQPVSESEKQDDFSGISGRQRRRSKRAWMIPGTLWCGAGHTASNFTDLGMFEETDKCCREHDHCKNIISSFGYNYGIFNINPFTLSHCDCDNEFRQCLHSANDSMSDVVGYGYFNVLKMQCFEFAERMQCAKRAWWGICQFSKLTTYALVKKALDYKSKLLDLNDTLALSSFLNTSAEDLTTTGSATVFSMVSVAPRTSSTVNTTQEPHSPTTHSAQTQIRDSSEAQTTDSPVTDSSDTTTSLQSQITDSPEMKTTDSPMPQTTNSSETQMTDSPETQQTQTTHSPGTTDSPQTKMTDSTMPQTTDSSQTQLRESPQTKSTDSPHTKSPQNETTASPQTHSADSTKTHIQPEQHTKQKGQVETCELYRDLDSCRHQIPALQEKFGLRNVEHTTLYHCSCTNRLAREFARHEKVNDVHLLLLDFVSQFCFILPQSESCPTSTESPLLKRWTKDVAAGHHLVGTKRKAKRLNSKRSKRKDSSYRLYKKCMRMHFKLHKPKETKTYLQGHSTSL